MAEVIRTFLRIRPLARGVAPVAWECQRSGNGELITFLREREAQGAVDHTTTQHKFRFDGVLTPEATQDEVFQRVAEEAVLSAVGGYNATVFAYGQTGSGKTYTITGGDTTFEERGLIPRALQRVFKELGLRAEKEWVVRASYTQIYNDTAHDLINNQQDLPEKANDTDLRKVSVLEDEDGEITVRSLGLHVVNKVEDGLELLFLG